METRASYVIVGSFVLAMIALLFVMVIYIAKIQLDEVKLPYHVYFSGSVTGLQEGSAVRYRGLEVGAVSDIRIAPQDNGQMRVTLDISSTTPITQDAVASIEMQGITGVAYIQIFGGAKGSPQLSRLPGQVPVIPSRPSQFSEVVDAAPQLLNRLILLSDKAALFLTPENADRFASIMTNLDSMTASGSKTMDEISKVAARSDKAVEQLEGVAREARLLVTENREPLHDFTTTGLYDAALLIAELRELVGNMSRISSQVQRDPSGFLLAGPRSGVEPSGQVNVPKTSQEAR